MMNVNRQMALTLCQIFRIISSTSKKALNINGSSSYLCLHQQINNRLVLKIKDGYEVELQTPETIKLIGSTKK